MAPGIDPRRRSLTVLLRITEACLNTAPRPAKQIGVLLALTAAYVVAGKLGLRLAFVNASATAVWAPTGIALAAFLIIGRRVWPAVLLGAFVVNVTTAGGVATSLGIAVGNTLEGLLGSWLVARYAGGRKAFDSNRDLFRFVLLAAVVSTAVSPTLGVTSLVLGGVARWQDYGAIWLTWWLGDMGGDIVVAPLILIWVASPREPWPYARVVEGVALLLITALTGQLVFGRVLPGSPHLPLGFLCMPMLMWAAFRFGRLASAGVVALFYVIAVHGTLLGSGPFARPSPNESLLLLQAFTCVVSVTTLTLATVVFERRHVEALLRQLAVSDPLTGLANYRRLIEVLESEIERSKRTERPFAVLFFDVNRLKQLNDRYGHLAGSRALWRVAEAMRKSSRAIDTAARYGGDEFAIVMPEASDTAAERVARRVADLLAADGEKPPVSVSEGSAMYPRDGETVAHLLAAADRAQYCAKDHPVQAARDH